MECVYPFTNENVTSYEYLYDFDNARVLSVLGSGDQYFASLLYGAKDVDLFDVNGLAYDFFVLKYYGILILSYDEFYDYFIIKELNDLKYFKRLIQFLPLTVVNRLCYLYEKYNGLSSLLFFRVIGSNENGGCIPYFDKENYYKLQSILLNRKFPRFYLSNFLRLSDKVDDKSYDVILTSNIFDWLYKDCEIESVGVYKEILGKFNYKEIQALYCWNDLDNDLGVELLRNGFVFDFVNCAGNLSLSSKNTVVSLRKTRSCLI